MDLLRDVIEVLINIRQWPSNHPKNKDWEEQWPDVKEYSSEGLQPAINAGF